MEYWRPERPDEWKMDEFIRETKALLDQIKAQQGTIDGKTKEIERLNSPVIESEWQQLQARVATLKQALNEAANYLEAMSSVPSEQDVVNKYRALANKEVK